MAGKQKTKKGTPSREQVRAWLYMVIAPILEGLRLEEYYLERKNPSWRFRGEGFEYLRPVDEYVRLDHEAVLAQFCRYYKDIAKRMSKHDESLSRLRAATKGLQAGLLDLATFRDLVQQINERYKDWRGAYRDEDGPALLAETTINWAELEDPAPHFSTAAPWREHRQRAVAILASEPLRDRYAEYRRELDQALTRVRELGNVLTKLRDDLADEHKVSPVPVPTVQGAPAREQFRSY